MVRDMKVDEEKLEKETCFFIGHRDAPESVYAPLCDAVERHITEYGVRSFVAGHYGRFDALAARAVLDAKKRHPGVTLSLGSIINVGVMR